MKTRFFLLCISLFTFRLSAQNLNFIADTVISANPDEWVRYNRIRIVTNFNTPQFIKFELKILNLSNELLYLTDTFDTSDSLGSGDTINASALLRNASLLGDFADHYSSTQGLLLGGSYLFKVKLFDSTNNNVIDSIERQIQIIEDEHPALISPADCDEIQDSLLNTTAFMWTKYLIRRLS